MNEKEQLVDLIKKERKQRKIKEARKTITITKEHPRIPTSQYHEIELGNELTSQIHSIEAHSTQTNLVFHQTYQNRVHHLVHVNRPHQQTRKAL